MFGFVGHAISNVGKTVRKAVVDEGHFIGKAANSTAGRVVIGGIIAASGVGLIAGAAIGASALATAGAIKPHGGFHAATVGAEQGAILGAASSVLGTVARSGAVSSVAHHAGDAVTKAREALKTAGTATPPAAGLVAVAAAPTERELADAVPIDAPAPMPIALIAGGTLAIVLVVFLIARSH